MTNVTLNVQGMSCGKCVKAVETAITELPGIDNVAVDLEQASVNVQYTEAAVSIEQIKEAIEDQGYDVQ